MVAFENFENVATMEHKSGTDEASRQESFNNMIQRKSLEPVQEEFIESEADTPIMLPSVVRDVANENKSNQSQKETSSPGIPDKRKNRTDSRNQRDDTQKNFNTINTGNGGS